MMKSPIPIYAALATGLYCVCCLALADEINEQSRTLPDAFAAEQARAINAQGDQDNWLLHGRTYSEQRYSPLTNINDKNVDKLGYAWSVDVNSSRGLEASPIVRDGVLYTTGAWSMVYAIDAGTGKQLWKYDPKVPGGWAVKGCCDIVNRGVAVWANTVVSATFDGRLIALDSKTGELLWEKNTIDRTKSATITAAPRVIDGKVLIGNSGAEFDVRGYISAYDINNGELLWRFYTVPKSTDGPHEHAELEIAAKTWNREGAWRETGGGGTVWDSLAYDPKLKLLYVGTGNGAPHARHVRSPGGGDHLFLSSILALDINTGKMQWYYQTTPGDSWDFTATQHMILADLDINGKTRQVLMQAPKNGFFYVLDRETGELLSAEKYATANWASHIDMKSGRPVETAQADYSQQAKLIYPSELGGHNWHPMSFNPDTGLVYIPALERAFLHSPNAFHMLDFNYPDNIEELKKGQPEVDEGGYLRAWDPIKQELAWEVKNPSFVNGGTLSTAGNLVFQGTQDGYLNAYNARTGERLLNLFLGTGVIAPPISYSMNGKQYIALMAGFGGATLFMLAENAAANTYLNSGRLIVLKLGGDDVPLPRKISVTAELTDMQVREANSKLSALNADNIRSSGHPGELTYILNCGFCHGMYGSKSLLPDLTRMKPEIQAVFKEIVLDGIFESKGMASFADRLSEKEVASIQEYLMLKQLERESGIPQPYVD